MANKLPTPGDRRIRKFPQVQHEGNGGHISEASEAALGIKWEGQPGPYDLRNKKIQAHDQFSQDLRNTTDIYMQEVYSILKQLRDQVDEESNPLTVATSIRNTGQHISKLVEKIRQSAAKITQRYIKENKIGEFPKVLDLDHWCYDGDVKKLDERVANLFNTYADQALKEDIFRPDTMTYSLFGLVFRIANTESMYLANHLLMLASKGSAQFGEYVSGENCPNSEMICDHYCNGIHTLATLHQRIPPFHPNCNCFAIYYTIDELNDSNKKEQS